MIIVASRFQIFSFLYYNIINHPQRDIVFKRNFFTDFVLGYQTAISGGILDTLDDDFAER
jgi:hypothetical protein